MEEVSIAVAVVISSSFAADCSCLDIAAIVTACVRTSSVSAAMLLDCAVTVRCIISEADVTTSDSL